MEQTDYYTPSIEDIRVGYECEIFCNVTSEYGEVALQRWTPYIHDSQMAAKWLFQKDNIIIRTPYLTKEQILSEGWELGDHHFVLLDCSDGGHNDYCWTFKKDNISLYFWQNQHELRLSRMDYSRETTRPSGFKDDFNVTFKCPSVNEFRIICKLLGI